jgi:integrase
MEKGQNTNRPAKGSLIKVYPIKEMKDIKNIKTLLADNPRDLCLFVLGINTNLRASDLLQITAGDVRHLKPGDTLNLKEKKTGKARAITVNKAVVEVTQRLLTSRAYPDVELLFTGQRGPITVSTVNAMVKRWCRAINLPENYGSHTLRKTFGYMQRTQAKTDIPTLMRMFNHSSQRQTLEYLCIQPEEIKDAYMRLEL